MRTLADKVVCPWCGGEVKTECGVIDGADQREKLVCLTTGCKYVQWVCYE